MPRTAPARTVLTLATALEVPLPRYRPLSPSRNSTASCSPVEAPEGTEAETQSNPSSLTMTRTVGLPRESRISNAFTASMLVDMPSSWF